MCMNDNTFSVPRQIGILGGTFQPIHLGHMDMALSALSVLNLDEVLLMPDRIPPHKDLPEGATDAQRLEMIRLSAQKYKGLTVSDMELMRPGKSYTADTLALLADRLPNAQLYFIMGSDMLRSLPSWYKPEQVCALARLVCVRRQGNIGGEEESAKKLAQTYGAKVTLFPPVREVSSTEIRTRARLGLPLENLVEPTVEQYICAHGLYAPAPIPSLTHRLKTELSPKRFTHTIGVVMTAERMAEHLHCTPEQARLCALLHDCAKELPMQEQYALAQRAKGSLLPTDIDPIVHAPAGSVLAREKYGIEDDQVLEAIRLHTTGESVMSLLDKILFLADMVEPGRHFEGVQQIRQAALNARNLEELDMAMMLAFRHNLCYIDTNHQPLHPASLRAMETLEKQSHQPKEQENT
jgi:nicotinate-nucleotide adenylyltransferase